MLLSTNANLGLIVDNGCRLDHIFGHLLPGLALGYAQLEGYVLQSSLHVPHIRIGGWYGTPEGHIHRPSVHSLRLSEQVILQPEGIMCKYCKNKCLENTHHQSACHHGTSSMNVVHDIHGLLNLWFGVFLDCTSHC